MPKKPQRVKIKSFVGFVKKYFRKYRGEWPTIILISSFALFFFLVVGYLGGFLGSSPERNFNKARSSFDSNLEQIVTLTNTSKEALGAIDSERQAGNYERVLEMVNAESERNNALKEKGYELSGDLRIMAENLGSLRPKEAVQEGLKAIDKGLDIFKATTDYTKYTENYLEATEKWARGERTTEVSDNIENSLSLSRKRADKLNFLAESYQRSMADFDEARK